MNTSESVKTLIEEFLAKRQAKVDAAKALNKGAEPTLDKFGRYHAPHDGYIWGDEAGDVYMGGQYLPDEDFDVQPQRKAKIKIHESLKTPEFSELFVQFKKSGRDDVSYGKSWAQREGSVCYAYVDGLPASLAIAIENLGLIVKDAEVVVNEYLYEDGQQITVVIKTSNSIGGYPTKFGHCYIDELITTNDERLIIKGNSSANFSVTTELTKINRQGYSPDTENFKVAFDKDAYVLEVTGIVKLEEYKEMKQTILTKIKITDSEINDWLFLQSMDKCVAAGDKMRTSKHEKSLLKKYKVSI